MQLSRWPEGMLTGSGYSISPIHSFNCVESVLGLGLEGIST